MEKLAIQITNYTKNRETIQSIRQQVFQVEQGIDPELEFDGQDETADHLIADWDGQPVGTARLRALDRDRFKIERLAVLSIARGRGIGKKLMQTALETAGDRGAREVVIHAQAYIKSLHQKLGFEQVGEPFEEAGIPHVKMRKILS